MKKSKVVQAFTLICFAALIITFLLYRSGEFDPVFQGSPNGGALSRTTAKIDTVPRTALSSSKVIIVTPRVTKGDTGFKVNPWTGKLVRNRKPNKMAPSSKRPTMMSSSKSAIIYKQPQADSTRAKQP